MIIRDQTTYEHQVKLLNDDSVRADYAAKYDDYRPSFLPRILGTFLIFCGNVMYGKEPSYVKFRAIEIIARAHYSSWDSAAYTLMTLFFFFDEERSLKLARTSIFARFALDNETMHIVVSSRLAVFHGKPGLFRGSLFPIWIAVLYSWSSYIFFFMSKRWSYELNYMFEQHAYSQYSRFLEREQDVLRSRPIQSNYLTWYGRTHENQYEFFRAVRNDELIHRNETIEAIKELKVKKAK